LSAAKATFKKKMADKLCNSLLSSVDAFPIHGECTLWLYRTILLFHLSVDAITTGTIRKLENLAIHTSKSGT